MNSNPMNDYRDAMKETRLSPEQRARLEEAVSQARLRHEEGSVAQPVPRIVTRRTFAIGAAAASSALPDSEPSISSAAFRESPPPMRSGLKPTPLTTLRARADTPKR